MVQTLPTKRNLMKNVNPPNGSWGIVQILSGKRNVMKNQNPPNGSWGIVQILSRKRNVMKNQNPPNVSWGIVQIRPSLPQKVHIARSLLTAFGSLCFGGWI